MAKRKAIKKKTRAKKGVSRRRSCFTKAQQKYVGKKLKRLEKDIKSMVKGYDQLLAALNRV